jgi:hypothetical protein
MSRWAQYRGRPDTEAYDNGSIRDPIGDPDVQKACQTISLKGYGKKLCGRRAVSPHRAQGGGGWVGGGVYRPGWASRDGAGRQARSEITALVGLAAVWVLAMLTGLTMLSILVMLWCRSYSNNIAPIQS